MNKIKVFVILSVLALGVSFPTKSEALPVPIYGPGVCGYFEIYMELFTPHIRWVSTTCPVQQ